MDVNPLDLTGFQHDWFRGEVEFLVGVKGTAVSLLVYFLPVFFAHGDFAVYVFVFGHPERCSIKVYRGRCESVRLDRIR